METSHLGETGTKQEHVVTPATTLPELPTDSAAIDHSVELLVLFDKLSKAAALRAPNALILALKTIPTIIDKLKKVVESKTWKDLLDAVDRRQKVLNEQLLVGVTGDKVPRKLVSSLKLYAWSLERLGARIMEQAGVTENAPPNDVRFMVVNIFISRSLGDDSGTGDVDTYTAGLNLAIDDFQMALTNYTAMAANGIEKSPDRQTLPKDNEDPMTKAEDDNDTGWESESDAESEAEHGRRTAIPPLLPVPTDLTSPNDRLCDVCKALDLSPVRFVVLPGDGETSNKPDDPNIALGLVEEILKKSYCPLCRLVLVALGGPEVPSFEDGEPVSVVMSWSTDGRKPNPDAPWHHIPQIRVLRPYARKGGEGYVRASLNLFPEITLLANDAPTSSKAFFIRPIQESQIDFGMVRNWISMCEKWHGQACNKSKMVDHGTSSMSDEIPSFRLIDVQDNCLVHGLGHSKYVALSYVWGRVQFLQTLKANVGDLEKPGAFLKPVFQEKIPLTIWDAMQVVRELGLRYLWVDGLCIIQDDDWEAKWNSISKMDLIYGAAFLTIMAATGDNANSGLPGVSPGTRGQRQPIEEIMPGFRLGFKPIYQNHIKDSVYYTRGWTFQEQTFSKRSLIFIGGQVVFRCLQADQWREDIVFEDETITVGDRGMDNTNDIGEFSGLIQGYSDLSLTYEQDIYNAFGGISSYIKRELKATLCHGIPDAYFDWFLLWKPLKPQVRRQCTPSWSWSGWIGGSWIQIWLDFSRKITEIRKAHRKRTWIIWHQRVAHDSTECTLVWSPKKRSSSSSPRNFYGSHIKSRFPFECTSTAPTPRMLVGAPTYYKDVLNPNPGSGFLQFWTVSATFRLDTPTSKADTTGPDNKLERVGFFGRDGREVGIVFVIEGWKDAHVPGTHEFILMCEGREVRPKAGKEDHEEGWKYMAMLIEWHGEWAERVSVGSIEKDDLAQALGGGPIWKEIILG